MTDHHVEDFIEAMLADRAPKAFAAVADDAGVLRVAIEMRALQGEVAPGRQFVESLHRCLAGAADGGATLLPFPAGVWQHEDAELTAAQTSAACVRPYQPRPRKPPRRLGVVAKAAAAAVLVGAAFTATNLFDGHAVAPSRAHVAAVDGVRSADLVSVTGRHLGQTYLYSADPSWVFMDVQHSELDGTYMCRLRLADGHDVTAGTLFVGDGRGEWAHTVAVDVSHLRTAMLETPAGQVVATATFS